MPLPVRKNWVEIIDLRADIRGLAREIAQEDNQICRIMELRHQHRVRLAELRAALEAAEAQ